MLGKQKCRILKEIRQRIADENDIPYVTRECTHQGHCSGTCPRCESEVRYLEDQLQKRASLGKRVTVAALCAGMALSVTGCDLVDNISSTLGLKTRGVPTPEVFVTEGEVAMPQELGGAVDEPEPTAETGGEKEPAAAPVPTDDPEEIFQLEGDVPYFPESDGDIF